MPVEDIRAILKVTTSAVIGQFSASLVTTNNSSSVVISEDFLLDHNSKIIKIMNVKPALKIHSKAFQSSRIVTDWFIFESCNISKLSFTFLTDFINLENLSFRQSNMPKLFNLISLPKLRRLEIVHCTGLNKWTEIPTAQKIFSTGIYNLTLHNNELNDEAVDRIIKWIKKGL